jgi:two-component system, OmpR family, response regulator
MVQPDLSQRSLAACPIPHQILLVGKPDGEQARLKRELDARGFHVTLAKDGGQAHASFAMRKPDLVLLDILLPGESGFEVCEWMKRNEPGIPVVILTEIDLPEARDLAEHVGADGYLISPCDGDVLVEHIKVANQKTWEKTHLEQPKEPGRVRFQCRCGKRLKVSATHRGKSMTCPNCGEPLIVPRHD